MTTAPAPVTGAEPTPRRLSHRQTGSDAVFEHVSRAIGASVLVITGGVGVFLAWQAFPTLQRYGFSFFLPSTWATWRTDGDGDGSADPQDLDDAAAAAAAYLCASGGSLTGPAWSAAVLSYNHDAGYVRLVHAAAEAYADRTG